VWQHLAASVERVVCAFVALLHIVRYALSVDGVQNVFHFQFGASKNGSLGFV